MVSTIISCGPFTAKKLEDAAEVVFPVNTQGDWAGTPEGQEKLDYAVDGLESAKKNGVIDTPLILDRRSDDLLFVTIPCETMEKAMKLIPELKDKIPFITNAVEKQPAHKVGM